MRYRGSGTEPKATTSTRIMAKIVMRRMLFFGVRLACMRSNENKMSDGGRDRALLGVEVWKSSQKWSVRRSAVRSIAWLGVSAKQLVRPYELLFETGRTRQRIARLEAICATDAAAERAPQNHTICDE